MLNLLLGLLLGLIITYLLQKRKFLKKNTLIISGYHIHHSVLGVLLILIGLILSTNYFLIGIGIGIIIAHTIANKELLFINKIKA